MASKMGLGRGNTRSKQKGKEMRTIIIGQPGCSQCKMLAMSCPDAEKLEPQPAELMALAQMLGVKSLPIVVCTGELGELMAKFKQTNETKGNENV